MSHPITRRSLIIVLLAALLIPLWAPMNRWLSARNDDGSIALKPPPFISVAHAQGGTSFADTEAGISAYIRSNSTINLLTVVNMYRTIEQQTDEYILGSMEVSGYDDSHDVKVYVHRDGWIMAYYPRNQPTSRIFDWPSYDGSGNLPTKLEKVLTQVSQQVGAPSEAPTFYHFAHPHANRLMLVAEYMSTSSTDSFEITLPLSFDFHESSWAHYKSRNPYNGATSVMKLDNSVISTATRRYIGDGLLTPSQFAKGVPHIVSLTLTGDADITTIGIAIVYEVP